MYSDQQTSKNLYGHHKGLTDNADSVDWNYAKYMLELLKQLHVFQVVWMQNLPGSPLWELNYISHRPQAHAFETC